MTRYADNGFGDLVPTHNPYEKLTRVYTKIEGKMAQFDVGTGDHQVAIGEVRRTLGDVRLSRNGRWRNGPVLAVIEGGYNQ